MFQHVRSRVASVVVVGGLVCTGSLLAAGAAHADPGDAGAVGASAVLAVDIAGIDIDANASVGGVSVTGAGSDSSQEEDYTLVDLALADITLGAVNTTADSDAAGSAATADLADVNASLLGLNLLTVDAVSAQATCPVGDDPAAVVDVAGLTVLGDAATFDAGTTVITSSTGLGAGVGGVDLTGLELTVTVTQVQTVTDDTSLAVALLATVTLDGDYAGGTLDNQVVATLTLASAACQTPAVTPVTATQIAPAVGPTTGGQTVTITGTGFTPDTTVNFGSNPATVVTVDPSGSSLTAVTPAGAVGPASVTVANPGSSAMLGYTYVEPAAASLEPDYGPTYGGTIVTISGQGLDTVTDVTFGGQPADIVEVAADGSSVTVLTPPGTGTVPVVLTLAGGTTVSPDQDFTYIAPAVSDITPSAGPTTGGTTITITGNGLGGATGVTIGGNPATIVGAPTETQIIVTTPPGAAGPADVTIVLPGVDVTITGGYLYVPAPVATGTNPDHGPTTGGTTVDVDGSGFVPGATTVTICGVTIPATQITVNQEGTRLRFVTPACAAGTATVLITTPGGISTPLPFRYTAATTAGSGNGSLASTGNNPAPALGIGFALASLGGLALIGIRRRRA